MKLVFTLSLFGLVLSNSEAKAFDLVDQGTLLLESQSFNFVAPTVSAESAVSDRQVGMIIYDISSGTFKGLNKDGTFDPMSSFGSNGVVSSGSSERIERAYIASGGSITSQSGWLASATNPSTGQYTLTITAGLFSAAPSCVATPVTTGNSYISINSTPTTTSVPVTQRDSSNVLLNGAFYIVCMGPR
jgi:hypothetical protein